MAIKSDFTPIDKKLESLVTYQEKLEYLEACLFKRNLALADFEAYSLADLERLKIKTDNDFNKWQKSFDEGNLFMFHESTNKHHEKRLGLDNIELLIQRINLENQYKNIIKQKSLFEAKIRETEKGLKNKAPRIHDKDFIMGIVNVKFPVVVQTGDTFTQYFEVEKEGEKRRFDIVYYLDLIAENYYLSCDGKNTLNEKLTILYDAEFTLNDIIREHELYRYNCDYSEVLQRLSDCIKRYEKQNGITHRQSQYLDPQQSQTTIKKDQTGNYWFKVGLLFANGEMDKHISDFKSNSTQIANKLGNSNFRPFISESISGTNTSDKNIFSSKKKMETIISYCKDNSITIMDHFLRKYDALTTE